MTLPLAIAVGDHGGVGPLVVRLALEARPNVEAIVFGSEVADDHRPTREGGVLQLRALDAAIAAVREGRARAVVTGPTSKEAIALGADPTFIGQTEHLARACGLADDAVTMMFLGPRLRIALVTTHVSVARAPSQITEARVRRTIQHLTQALLALASTERGERPAESSAVAPLSSRERGPGGVAERGPGGVAKERVSGFRSTPIIEVAGLNPHLGEHGLFGDEDETVVAPAVAALRLVSPFSTGEVELRGPRPAEAVLRAAANGEIDGVVAMIHDQATIPSKLLDWGHAVNVTWGLPFVRTSVDHGVAYDAAARGDADPTGMIAAIDLAERLAR